MRAAMRDAGIADPADVHFVQLKCPLLTAQRIGEATGRGAVTATTDTLKSMGLSRAASTLGAAVALGEIDRATLRDADIGTRWDLWSGRTSSSAGIELLGPRDRRARHVVRLVRAARHRSCGDDGRDRHRAGARSARPARSGVCGAIAPKPSARRLVALLAKAEASHDGRLRGNRHTMLDDSDIAGTRHARAFVCGALAGLVGHAEIYVSGGAEHQGPDGGGPVAAIVDRSVR